MAKKISDRLEGEELARPQKPEREKKKKRLTVYFTEEEAEKLEMLARTLQLEKTKIVTRALNNYIKVIENPPEPLKKANISRITGSDMERVNGYVCPQGHAFWLEFEWPHLPKCCPACGSEDLKKTWIGTVRKGF